MDVGNDGEVCDRTSGLLSQLSQQLASSRLDTANMLSLLHHCLLRGLDIVKEKAYQSEISGNWRVGEEHNYQGGDMTVVVDDITTNLKIKMKCPSWSVVEFHSPSLAQFLKVPSS